MSTPFTFICTPSKLSFFTYSKSITSHRHAHHPKPFTQNNRSIIRAPTRMGLIPFIPNWILLAGWIYGSIRFYKGFSKTSYKSSFRLPLTIAWPLLFLLNSSYRTNFRKSLQSSDDY